MVQREELIDYLAKLLDVEAFEDYAPNGLQVEGCSTIKRIIGGVTACQALVDAAVEQQADVLLVHHGYFWKGEDPCLTGMKQRRLKSLLTADINLFAYHLPLDAHQSLGNNAQLATLLDLTQEGTFAGGIGHYGRLKTAQSVETFAALLADRLGRQALFIAGNGHHEEPSAIKTLAWCTGAAQGYIEQAAALGVDAFISGEISEQTVHSARELGIHYFAAGHHATECGGVQALGQHLADKFDLEFVFVDVDNPV